MLTKENNLENCFKNELEITPCKAPPISNFFHSSEFGRSNFLWGHRGKYEVSLGFIGRYFINWPHSGQKHVFRVHERQILI